MSFFLTTKQIHRRSKTVTRRGPNTKVKVGDVRQPIVKGQGLKKGEHVEKIGGPIRITSVRRERLFVRSAVGPHDGRYGADEAAREGFPDLLYGEFVDFYVSHNGGRPSQRVTRIEFEYVEEVHVA